MNFKFITDAIGFTSNKEVSVPVINKKEDITENISPDERKELFSWKVSVGKSVLPKRYKSTILILGTLFLIYLLLNRDLILIVLILSLVFLYNILYSVGDNVYEYKIYTNGIEYFNTFYSWDKFRFFFFFTDKDLIGLDTVDVIPGRLYVYFKPEDREKLENILIVKLDKALVVPKSYMDLLVDKVKPYIDLSEK